MELTRVEIQNFRSIEAVTLDLATHRAVGLVGVNESGKTNVLKALALLSPERKGNTVDVRMPRSMDEGQLEGVVRFHFRLSRAEHESLAGAIIGTQVVAKEESSLTFAVAAGHLSLVDLLEQQLQEVSLQVNVETGIREVMVNAVDFGEPVRKWARFTGSQPTSMEVPWATPNQVSLKPGALICLDDFDPPSKVPGGSAELTQELFANQLTQLVRSRVEASLPKVVYWAHGPESLLPESVNLETFTKDPSTCRPLQSIFELGDVPNITASLAEAKKRSYTGYENLFNRVAKRATERLHSSWKGYAAASIRLTLHGTDIRISVFDKDVSSPFGERSDGFKRFVTFLLMVSAKLRSSNTGEVLLLIDEPEISLHPTGIRSLRDELLYIAQTNYVVYATHSPHMIDREDVSRHYIVEKLNEVTKCRQVDKSRLVDEEVLLNALGCSVFETLKPMNLLFEGWRDKRLFEVFLHANKKNSKVANLHGVGTAHLLGVKDVKTTLPLMALANVRVTVVSDHDQAAMEARKQLETCRFEHAEWLTYQELEGDGSAAYTVEDFVTPAHLLQCLAELCAARGLLMPTVAEGELEGNNRLGKIEGKLKAAGVKDSASLKPLLDAFKSVVFDQLKPAHIDQRYMVVMEKLSQHLESNPRRRIGK